MDPMGRAIADYFIPVFLHHIDNLFHRSAIWHHLFSSILISGVCFERQNYT